MCLLCFLPNTTLLLYCVFCAADILRTITRSLEVKKGNVDKLRQHLKSVQDETEGKLAEIDMCTAESKVNYLQVVLHPFYFCTVDTWQINNFTFIVNYIRAVLLCFIDLFL